MTGRLLRRGVRAGVMGALLCAGAADASPWAEVGDSSLRSDLALLAAGGAVADLTSQWPMPWTGVVHDLNHAPQSDNPVLHDAADRVMTAAHRQTADGWQAGAVLDLTNRPNPVHDFGGLGRGDGEAQATLSYNSKFFSLRLAADLYSRAISGPGTRISLSDSYAAVKLGDALLYAGAVSHWWGPGWISALSLSNNAFPVPQIGIQRLQTTPLPWPVLRWLGPWQAEFFVGLLDGKRIDNHTLFNGLRFSFNPAPGLQIGLARTQEFCGEHHACDPIRGYFDLNNDPLHQDITNDEGLIDIQYTHELAGQPASFYMQVMNEDSSPFTHSGTSHLFGVTFWRALAGHLTRITVEYSDSVPTNDIFSFGDVMHGFAYTNFTYLDGMRYRGRTLGFSLDTDSRLASLQAAWNDDSGRFYQVSLHRAFISNPANPQVNVVTSAPVTVDLAELRLGLPMAGWRLDLAGRLEDDQPRPHRGFAASLEMAIHLAL